MRSLVVIVRVMSQKACGTQFVIWFQDFVLPSTGLVYICKYKVNICCIYIYYMFCLFIVIYLLLM